MQMLNLWQGTLLKQPQFLKLEKTVIFSTLKQYAASCGALQSDCVTGINHLEMVRGTKHWYRLPKEAKESLSLEVYKSHLDMVLGNLFWVALLEKEGWTR